MATLTGGVLEDRYEGLLVEDGDAFELQEQLDAILTSFGEGLVRRSFHEADDLAWEP